MHAVLGKPALYKIITGNRIVLHVSIEKQTKKNRMISIGDVEINPTRVIGG
jgi:hypothetical protein